MSRFVVQPSPGIAGSVRVPGDKSISHRALMLGAIADGATEVEGFLEGEDCLSTLRAVAALGVDVTRPAPGAVRIAGAGLRGLDAPSGALDMGNAGTAMRLFMGLLSAQAFESELVGDASLMRRPMERAAKPLRAMGAEIETRDGRPPVRIHGGRRLRGIRYEMPVASAQVKSAALLAGLYAEGETTVTEPAVTRDHTERMLQSFGVDVRARGGTVTVRPPTRLEAARVSVPGDFSSAAFFIVAACIGAREPFVVERVGVNPTRTGLLEMLALMGADLRLINHRSAGAEPVADVEVRPAPLKGVRVPERLVPLAIDEFPAFFVAAACAEGETLVTGAEELRVKESDRIAVMAEGLGALGVEHEILPDGMRIQGGPIVGGRVDSKGDHRVAMSFAVASLQASGPIEIDDVANVATSFPGFAGLARSVGLRLEGKAVMGAVMGTQPFSGTLPFSIAENMGAASSGEEKGSVPEKGCVPVIAIDGPSGSGKGTVARIVAERLGWHLLDSGALYRLVALAGAARGLAPDDAQSHAALAAALDARFEADERGGERVLLDGQDVSGQLRTERTGNMASVVAAMPAVRTALLGRQRAFAEPPGLVADGRDMGTVVFPDAGLKIFLTASAEERARRRHKQLMEKGLSANLSDLSREILERDRRDSERSVAPLRPATDAVVVDSTGLTIDEVVEAVLAHARTAFPSIG